MTINGGSAFNFLFNSALFWLTTDMSSFACYDVEERETFDHISLRTEKTINTKILIKTELIAIVILLNLSNVCLSVCRRFTLQSNWWR